MRILWVATKAPWPPVDGGRLLLYETLRALRSAGHQLTVVAPLAGQAAKRERITAQLRPLCRAEWVDARPRPLVLDVARAQLRRAPLTIVRHALPALRRRVEALLRAGAFDVVQAEQVQALEATAAAGETRVPLVLRAQNVESDLWAQTAQQAGLGGWPLRWEARRLAAWEGAAVRRCAATFTLTAEDGERLAALSGAGEKIYPVPAPFESELPAASEPLPGAPAIVLFGSRGWRPNASGASWFLRRAWPRVRQALPEAVLHVFGDGRLAEGAVHHPSPSESRSAYPPGSILVVPLRIASGVRIKILEAWARGVPVVATPQAARGLDAEDGRHLLLAVDGAGFAAALKRLAREPGLGAALVESGRRRLRRRHTPSRIAERLETLYGSI